MWSKKNDLFSLNFFFFPLKFHIHNPETFLLYVGFLRGLMAIEQAWRLSGLLADCMWAGKAWTASFKHGLCFASQKLVTKKKKAWSITPINEISQYQRCLEIRERTDPWGYLSYYHQNTGLFLAAFFERQAFKEQSNDFLQLFPCSRDRTTYRHWQRAQKQPRSFTLLRPHEQSEPCQQRSHARRPCSKMAEDSTSCHRGNLMNIFHCISTILAKENPDMLY